MEMGGAGVAAFPYVSDAITRLYELTGSDSSAEQMGVKGLPAIAMIQHNSQSISRDGLHDQGFTGECGQHSSSGRSNEIVPCMQPPLLSMV